MRKYDLPSQFDGHSDGIVIAGHFQTDDTYYMKRPLGMNDWLIALTLSGKGFFETPGAQEICSEGDVVLLKPHTPHAYGTVSNQTWNFTWAHFSANDIEETFLPLEPLTRHSLDTESILDRISSAFRRILSDFRGQDNTYWHELCLSSLKEILLLLASRRIRTMDPRIEETLHYLSVHMRSPVRIEDIAKAVGLSASRLSHLFKESTGLSIINTLNRMRIRQAALLLKHTSKPATEIAYDVGYHNYNHFINQFHKWYGMSPTAYRASNQ